MPEIGSTVSPEYAAARAELWSAERALVDQIERVAALRRALPPGPVLEEYELEEARYPLSVPDDTGRVVRLAELFTRPDRALIVYHFMFGKRQTSPCPMCTMWIDGFDGVAGHVTQNADLVVVAAADLVELREHARRRGWRRLRLVSAGTSTFKADLGSEDASGNQASMISVLTLEEDGRVRHRYAGTPSVSAERNERGIDLLCPTWGLLDLTPHGRGEWYASLDDT